MPKIIPITLIIPAKITAQLTSQKKNPIAEIPMPSNLTLKPFREMPNKWTKQEMSQCQILQCPSIQEEAESGGNPETAEEPPSTASFDTDHESSHQADDMEPVYNVTILENSQDSDIHVEDCHTAWTDQDSHEMACASFGLRIATATADSLSQTAQRVSPMPDSCSQEVTS